jgi:hypothetical protein
MKTICAAPDCQRETVSCGYCGKHYSRLRRSGDIQSTYRMTHDERVLAIIGDIPQLDPEQCWEYQGRCESNGYGKRFGLSSHRVAYLYWHPNTGGIDQDYEVRHACDNRPCCNPHHLLLGTRQDNVNDMMSRNRASVGESRKIAKLTERDVKAIRKDNRSNPDIAADYRVHRRTISDVKRRKTWKHVA